MPSGKNVRVENGFTEGMTVSSAFDPMLAKLIVHGQNRKQALEQGIQAIKDTVVLGLTTNADYLARVLEHPAFAKAWIHTGFIPQYANDLKAPVPGREERQLLLGAAALSSREFVDPAYQVPEPYALFGNWRN